VDDGYGMILRHPLNTLGKIIMIVILENFYGGTLSCHCWQQTLRNTRNV